MARKAQFGFDSMLGYITFALFLFFTIIVLSLGGCDKTKRRVAGLETDDAVKADIVELRASQQLSGYFRTNMLSLAELNLKIDTLNEKLSIGKDSKEIDIESVKNFLREHPETHVGKTYAEFISALSAYVNSAETKGVVNDVFDAVTKATFSRKLYAEYERDAYSNLEEFYFSPFLVVRYTSFSDKGRYELISKISSVTLDDKTLFVTRVLPTDENSIATVQMTIYGDEESLPGP